MAAASRLRLDLNSPEFQDVFFRLERAEFTQVVAALRRLHELDWNTVYRHAGFRWEAIEHLKAPNQARVYSLRLSQRVRAVAYRDGDFLRLISLHPDHDSELRALIGAAGPSDARRREEAVAVFATAGPGRGGRGENDQR